MPNSEPLPLLTLSSEEDDVFMRTATVKEANENSMCDARRVFNTGAQRSFITLALAKRLNLKPKGHLKRTVAPFANENPREQTYPIVSLNVILANGEAKKIDCHVVPIISVPLHRAELKMENYSILKEVKLADPVPHVKETFTLDLLIGQNYYEQLVCESQQIALGDNLKLTKSKFGWILSGAVQTRKNLR